MTRSLVRRVGLVVTAVLALSGCATAREVEAQYRASSAADEGCPWKMPTVPATEVRIGFQGIPTADLLVKHERWLERCAPAADVQWLKFDSGADVVRAFTSGSIDIGLAGSVPATKAVSPPLRLPLQVIWVHDVIGDAEALVTRDAEVRHVEDLRGKRVATPYGSTAHYSLLRTLRKAGLTEADVDVINLSPDAIVAAWDRREIDAAWIWAPALTHLQASGRALTTSGEAAAAGSPTFDLGLATAPFVKANPEFMTIWVQAQNQGVHLIARDPDTAAPAISAELGAGSEEMRGMLAGYTYLDAQAQAGVDHLGGAMGGHLEQTAAFLQAQGEIPTHLDAAEYQSAHVWAGGVSRHAPR